MRIGILQPGYLPWLGFFEQLAKVDIFVLYDDVQYTTKDWRSRNKIKTANSSIWLTVPTHGSQQLLINEVKLVQDNVWKKKHLKSIELSYKKAPYFDWLMPDLERIINKELKYLIDLDSELITMLANKIGIKTNIINSSSLNIQQPDKNIKIIETIKALDGTYFYDGKSSQEFIDVPLFNQHGITVEFQDYKHPTYPQLWGTFVPYLSVIDLLFNVGEESFKYIINKN
ncbi:MAG: WbqC family protein [bacterium]